MTSQTQSHVTNEILQGNLIKLVFKLSIPSILGILVLSLNTFLDALFAGRFIGEAALAGISLALPLTDIVNGFALLVGVGSASVVSRAIGSGDIKTQSKIFGCIVALSVAIAFLLTTTGYSFGEKLITLMGGSGETALAGAEYFKTYVLGSLFLILAGACNEVIKSEGKIKLATIFNFIFVLVNIILNSIFVTVFHFGVRGIALATVIASVVYSIVNLAYFFSGKSLILAHPKKLVIAIDLLPAILSVGVSALFYPVMVLVQKFVTFNAISYYGTNNDIAFFGAAGQIALFVMIPIVGFAQALQPVIGINYGAKNYTRLKKAYLSSVICGTILLMLIWIPIQLYSKDVLTLILPSVNFTNNDLFNFRILTILLPIWPLAFCSNTLFQSLGKGKIILILLLLRSIGLNVPMLIIFSKILGLRGIYYGLIFADILFLLIVFIVTFKEFKSLNLKQC